MNLAYQCECDEKRRKLRGPVNELELPLNNGRHTAVSVLVCSKCGKFSLFPDSNWRLFLHDGIPVPVKTMLTDLETAARSNHRVLLANMVKMWLGRIALILLLLVALAFLLTPMLMFGGHK
jgi:hypothetical protein